MKAGSAAASVYLPNQTKAVRLLDGVTIDITLDRPNLIDSEGGARYTFDFSWIDQSSEFGGILLRQLVGLLSTHSVSYSRSVLNASKNFFTKCNVDQTKPLQLADITTFPQCVKMSYWPFFRALLVKLKETASDVLSEEVRRFLEQPEKFEEEGKGAYFVLVTNDPYRGALTEQELKDIQYGVNNAYQAGILGIDEYTLVWLFIATGVRPIQMGKLTLGDVRITNGPEGKEIMLMMPLAKGEKSVVSEKWARRSPTVLVDILLSYLAEIHPGYRDLPPDTPLFKIPSSRMAPTLKAIFRKVPTWSDRLEGPIPIHPYRFRYTLGTRALAQGASDHEVARLLTHRTTWCIKSYKAAMPALQRPIKNALSGHMDLISKAFRGRLIKDLDEASRNGDDAALIRDFLNLAGDSIGACGTLAKCYQNAPVACLTCDKFEPFVKAPWEDLLTQLQDDVERETDDRIKSITIDAINATNQIIAQRDAMTA